MIQASQLSLEKLNSIFKELLNYQIHLIHYKN